jgi:SAM-dependent methyltransferase
MGYNVTGIDYSKRSIAYAKSQDTKTEYIYKNYLMINYTDLFDAITLINCDYGALIPNERQMLLSKVYHALKPGGLFIFDVFSEKYFKDKEEERSWTIRETSGFWSPEPHVCLGAKYFYENNTVSVDQHIVITNENIHEYLTWDTAYTVQTLKNELSPFGLETIGVFDDACGSPYSSEADILCSVAMKHD